MYSLIAYGFILILWALNVIINYYSSTSGGVDHTNTGYAQAATGASGYVITMLLLYGLYKAYTIFISPKKDLKFSFWTITGLTFLHIFIVCVFYSSLPEIRQSPLITAGSISSITLFVHIVKLILYPLLLVLITRCVGYALMSLMLPLWRTYDIRVRIGAEISLGFIVFTALLLLLGSIGTYTLGSLSIILGIMSILSIPGLRETYTDIRDRSVSLENHKIEGTPREALNLHLISVEFGFFFLTFFLAVSLINVIRPMPIGWDDLGVYMNFPKMIALSGELLQGAGMYSWQLITSTGFLFGNNASQAFYINQLGGILAVVVIVSTLSYIFEEKDKKSLLSLPVLFGALYYIMPMTVFQQAKDMKLDPAYLFFCISGLALLFSLWKGELSHERKNLLTLTLAGVIIGFTFSVKFTSVMLILAGLGLIAYRLLSIWGYLGFFFLFLAIFTYGDLWKIMNVPMPRDNMDLIHTVSILLCIMGTFSIVMALYKKHDLHWTNRIYTWIISSIVFTLAVGAGSAPWLAKNFGELGIGNTKSNPMSILSGSGGTLPYAYEKLYSKEELEKIMANVSVGVTNEGQTKDEDLGRYFGYDSGLNNYLKLPINLTLQKNQTGEFTDITYIFLALFPGALLFVRSRRSSYSYFIVSILTLAFFYYFVGKTGASLTDYLSGWSLGMNGNYTTYGYVFLLVLNLIFVVATHSLLSHGESNKKIKDTVVFMGIYAFLFMISAFGIVWYGIVVYYGFFILIGLGLSNFLDYSKDDEKDENTFSVNLTLASIVFLLIAVYFLRSGFAHGWTNLRSAYYNEYKYNTLSQEESIFAYRSDYLLPIATLNLKDTNKLFDGLKEKLTSAELKKMLGDTAMSTVGIEKWHTFVLQNRNSTNIPLRNDARMIGTALYDGILYPKKENANTGNIYRIGTFMTYLINENRKRYFDDSLVVAFDRYFYDKSPDITIDRMKKMGLAYLLVDLNAATIDKDPRHALTTRFEHLLLTMNSSSLRLVATDNFCLELALSEKKKGKITTNEEFLSIAGTNYESYKDNTSINRGQKVMQCQQYIIKMLNEGRNGEYPIVDAIKNEITSGSAAQDPQKIAAILSKYTGQSWFALFEIIDAPTLSEPTVSASSRTTTPVITTGSTKQ